MVGYTQMTALGISFSHADARMIYAINIKGWHALISSFENDVNHSDGFISHFTKGGFHLIKCNPLLAEMFRTLSNILAADGLESVLHLLFTDMVSKFSLTHWGHNKTAAVLQMAVQLKLIFLNEYWGIVIKISLKVPYNGMIDSIVTQHWFGHQATWTNVDQSSLILCGVIRP